ncbi:uncharacterized protein LOC110063135 isoform X2 [Orbicella faveolata]|uniref:uncharacterized protein LOC110063135 isoform X2 n=1 Tax=Orbicella faveolata TaxID=48498 RepID=UPI0009E49354|nr:uncharacterized protein LOC110063135 isoform X2 [Orbicella faveolata]
MRSGRKSAPWTSAEGTRFSSIVLGLATALKGSSQQIIQGFHLVSAMTSECVVFREFFAQEACESVSPKNGDMSSNGSLETETIQKFLSICLKQYFSSSQDDTKEKDLSCEDSNVDSQLSADVTCTFCKDDMTPVTLALKNHLDVCPLFPVKCPNMCGKMEVPREKVEYKTQN